MDIQIKQNSGFNLKFENGWTISILINYGSYSDNKNHPGGIYFADKLDVVGSNTAEIAIWDINGKWYNFDYDTVKGYCSPNEIAEWIDKVSKFEPVNVNY